MVPEQALKVIKKWEGLRLTAYKCPAGKWTVGYGNTYIFGRPVRKGDKISPYQAEIFLTQTCLDIADRIKRVIKVPVSDNQLAAIISLAYNCGVPSISRSTLIKKLNKGDYKGAANEFDRWVYAGGRKLQGLINRRKEEKTLFLS